MRAYVDGKIARFDHPAQQLLALGARQVLLGKYEPRHLVQAIGQSARTSQAPFARFGLDLPAWQKCASTNP